MKTYRNVCHKLSKCGKKNYKKMVSIAVCIYTMLAACTAFAAEESLETAQLASPMGTVFNFVVKISVPLAVIGVGACVFSFFLSSEKGYEVAKKRLLHIGLAVAGIAFIPLVINFVGKTPFKTMAWKPYGSNFQLIANVDNKVYNTNRAELSDNAMQNYGDGSTTSADILSSLMSGLVLGNDGKLHTADETGFTKTSDGTYVMCCECMDSVFNITSINIININLDRKQINGKWYMNLEGLLAGCCCKHGLIHTEGCNLAF